MSKTFQCYILGIPSTEALLPDYRTRYYETRLRKTCFVKKPNPAGFGILLGFVFIWVFRSFKHKKIFHYLFIYLEPGKTK